MATLTSVLQILETSIREALGAEVLNGPDAKTRILELFELSRGQLKTSSLLSHKSLSEEAISREQRARTQFEKRTLQRWRPAFDHLEMLWCIACELGEAHSKDVKERDDEDNNLVMAALADLYPKGLLVAQEILCLLKGGFPDGALARWRSLHELSVSAMYVAKHGDTAAKEYLQSFHFSARRAAVEINATSERSGLEKFTIEELDERDALCKDAERVLGRKIDKDVKGEWPRITGKTFDALERDVGMDHWRPWYKWASGQVHSGHRPQHALLGMAEANQPLHLVGASNSGFVDPFQLTALTLSQLVSTFLKHSLNLDRIIHIEVFRELAGEMAEIALAAQEASRERHVQSS